MNFHRLHELLVVVALKSYVANRLIDSQNVLCNDLYHACWLLLLRYRFYGPFLRGFIHQPTRKIGSQSVILAIRLDSNKTVIIIITVRFTLFFSGKSKERGVVLDPLRPFGPNNYFSQS